MTDGVNRQQPSTDADLARRNFLKSCGKFAVVTPPAMSLLLSTSLDSPAVAASGANGDGSCSILCKIGNVFD